MSLSRAELTADLKASLHDAANVFDAAADADFHRHLDHAALDLGRFRPLIVQATLTLVASTNAYAAPSDIQAIHETFWGLAEREQYKPYETGWPGRLPRARLLTISGGKYIWLTPAPTAAQITALGNSWSYSYVGKHVIGDQAADTTVRAADRGLLLLRAQAEAMTELAARNMHKPVRLRDGLAGTPSNGMPAALARQLMERFEKQAAA